MDSFQDVPGLGMPEIELNNTELDFFLAGGQSCAEVAREDHVFLCVGAITCLDWQNSTWTVREVPDSPSCPISFQRSDLAVYKRGVSATPRQSLEGLPCAWDSCENYTRKFV